MVCKYQHFDSCIHLFLAISNRDSSTCGYGLTVAAEGSITISALIGVCIFLSSYLLLWVFLAQMLGYLSAACPSQLGAPLINYLTELETCGAQTLLCVQEFWNVKQKPIYESVF